MNDPWTTTIYFLLWPLLAAQAQEENPQVITAADYWYYVCFGANATVDDEQADVIRGTLQRKHEVIHFRIRKEKLEPLEARNKGCIRAVESLISLVEYGETEQKKSFGNQRLRALTQEQLDSPIEWKEWLRANRENLTYRVDEDLLSIDKDLLSIDNGNKEPVGDGAP